MHLSSDPVGLPLVSGKQLGDIGASLATDGRKEVHVQWECFTAHPDEEMDFSSVVKHCIFQCHGEDGRLENSAGTDGPKLTPCAVQRKVVNSEKVQWWTEVSSCDVRLLIYDPWQQILSSMQRVKIISFKISSGTWWSEITCRLSPTPLITTRLIWRTHGCRSLLCDDEPIPSEPLDDPIMSKHYGRVPRNGDPCDALPTSQSITTNWKPSSSRPIPPPSSSTTPPGYPTCDTTKSHCHTNIIVSWTSIILKYAWEAFEFHCALWSWRTNKTVYVRWRIAFQWWEKERDGGTPTQRQVSPSSTAAADATWLPKGSIWKKFECAVTMGSGDCWFWPAYTSNASVHGGWNNWGDNCLVPHWYVASCRDSWSDVCWTSTTRKRDFELIQWRHQRNKNHVEPTKPMWEMSWNTQRWKQQLVLTSIQRHSCVWDGSLLAHLAQVWKLVWLSWRSKVHNWERAHSVNNCTYFMYFGTGRIRVETKLRHPDSAEPCFMVQKSATQMSGERGPKKHCTRLPSQRSACCCSPSLMGDSETLQQTQNTAQQPAFATQMNNQNRWSSHREEITKKRKGKERLTLHCPLPLKMEPFLLILPFVFTLLSMRLLGLSCAPPTALVALRFYSQFVAHYSGRSRLLHLSWRLSSTTTPVSLLVLGFLKVDRFVQFHMLVVQPLPLLIHQMPLKMAWQMACHSSSTGGPHRLSPNILCCRWHLLLLFEMSVQTASGGLR